MLTEAGVDDNGEGIDNGDGRASAVHGYGAS